MPSVRCLNDAGVQEFAGYLARLRSDATAPPPFALLEDPRFTRPTALGAAHVEHRDFANRREFADYVDARFRMAGIVGTADEPGLWEWLSLFYFDAVCPPDAAGRRQPGAANRHLVNSAFARRRHRHLLRGPYMLHRRYRGGPNGELDLLLAYPLHVHGVAATHLVERPRLLDSPGVLAAANRLYFDTATAGPKPGYADDSSGLRSFCRFLNNLPAAFDLAHLGADTVLAVAASPVRRLAGRLRRHGAAVPPRNAAADAAARRTLGWGFERLAAGLARSAIGCRTAAGPFGPVPHGRRSGIQRPVRCFRAGPGPRGGRQDAVRSAGRSHRASGTGWAGSDSERPSPNQNSSLGVRLGHGLVRRSPASRCRGTGATRLAQQMAGAAAWQIFGDARQSAARPQRRSVAMACRSCGWGWRPEQQRSLIQAKRTPPTNPKAALSSAKRILPLAAEAIAELQRQVLAHRFAPGVSEHLAEAALAVRAARQRRVPGVHDEHVR